MITVRRRSTFWGSCDVLAFGVVLLFALAFLSPCHDPGCRLRRAWVGDMAGRVAQEKAQLRRALREGSWREARLRAAEVRRLEGRPEILRRSEADARRLCRSTRLPDFQGLCFWRVWCE